MCGFLVTKGEYNNEFIKLRGDTLTNKFKKNGYVFIHNLLNITGEVTPQPFVEDDIVCIYNGEIYNQPFKKSDGECLIPLYKKYGKDFVKHLDGEWAIALYDFKKDITIFATDIFGTKPLWVKGNECASYESGVGGEKVKANTLIVNGVKEKIYEFDFNNQTKETYDDWIRAFERAISKRKHSRCFIGLSSGYDSGGIDCELKKQGADYKAYSIQGQENQEILKARGGDIVDFDEAENDFIKKNVEPYEFQYYSDNKLVKKMLHSDKAIYGLGKICRQALKDGRNVYLSGQGADEIMCDYSKFPSQSEFKGTFPDKLYEWRSFAGGQMENYIMKEEMIAGAYSIETRYPYLDVELIQEFLWLTPELKNKYYKAPLHEYLTINKYPFDEDKKIGFNPVKR